MTPSDSPGESTGEPALPKAPGSFRVIHTADWHLGKALGDLDRTEEHGRFLKWLETAIRENEADALVISGDVFDSATPPQSAIRLYFDFLASLHRNSRCQVVVTAGNHDSPAHLDAPRDLLRLINARIAAFLPRLAADPGLFDPQAVLIPLPSPENPKVIVAAVPFLRERELRTGALGQSAAEIRRELQEGLKSRYAEVAAAAGPWLARGVPVMVTGHLTALGATASESEREIHVGGLGAIAADGFPPAFAYVALGHLHRPQAVGGEAHIRYSGSPIALSFSEASDSKEVRVLDFADGKLAENRPLPVPQIRRLMQLRVAHAEIENRLRDFVPPPCELPPWVEVVVEMSGAASGSEGLYKAVQEAAVGRPFQVIRVMMERAATLAALGLPGLDDAQAEAEAENLLAKPQAVFARRLEAEALSGEERASVILAFEELCGLHEDRRRAGD